MSNIFKKKDTKRVVVGFCYRKVGGLSIQEYIQTFFYQYIYLLGTPTFYKITFL